MSPGRSSERKEWLLDILLRRPERQPPSGWWQDAKGRPQPPGSYVPPPPRPKGLRGLIEERRRRRFGA